MNASDIQFFEPSEVIGMSIEELDAVDALSKTAGWKAILKYIGALMDPVRSSVFANTDPDKQLLLHKGLGAIYIANNLMEFVSSAGKRAELLLQQEKSAREKAEQGKTTGLEA